MISASGDKTSTALRRAAVRATLAPSVLNTQPWHFVIHGDVLEVRADQTRRLPVGDPVGRQLVVSCGCALFNARVSLAATGREVVVDRFPDLDQPDLLARITVIGETADHALLCGLDPAIERRRTNCRPFTTDLVADEVVARLVAAACAEDARLLPVTGIEDCRDGSASVPAPDPSAATRLLSLTTHQDSWLAWLRAGEALERVLLTVCQSGLAAGILGQLVEVAGIRSALRREFGGDGWPQVLVQVGWAAESAATRRRLLVEMITELG